MSIGLNIHPIQQSVPENFLKDRNTFEEETSQDRIDSIFRNLKKISQHNEATKKNHLEILDQQQEAHQIIKEGEKVLKEQSNHLKEIQEDIEKRHNLIQTQQVNIELELHDIHQQVDQLESLTPQYQPTISVYNILYKYISNARDMFANISPQNVHNLIANGILNEFGIWISNKMESAYAWLNTQAWSLIKNIVTHPISLIAFAILSYVYPVVGIILGSVALYILMEKIYHFIHPYFPSIIQNKVKTSAPPIQ